jgi:hypothetical protein
VARGGLSGKEGPSAINRAAAVDGKVAFLKLKPHSPQRGER